MKRCSGGARRSGVALTGVSVTLAVGSACLAGVAPLGPGEAAWKPHASVPQTPKYATEKPDYFTVGNVVATLVSNISGGLQGAVTSVVYRNPENDCLAFQYFFEAGASSPSPMVRSTLAGAWDSVSVTGVGADGTGSSGSADAGAEWTDGDPLSIALTSGLEFQWSAAGIGSGLAAGDFSSSIWAETDAKRFEEAGMAALDTAVTGSGRVLGPSIIPLPGSAALCAAGLFVSGAVRRRR